MRPSDALRHREQSIREVVARFHASNPRVFGSVLHGLDTDGSSLSFELSQDGNLFDHDQKDGHGAGGGAGGADGEDADGTEIEIIETTMDWYADPETGLLRYSALV